MIIDCAAYIDGVRKGGRLTVEEAATEVLQASVTDDSRDHFVWIGLHEPSELELGDVAEAFGLDAPAVRDGTRNHQRPKLQVYEHGVLVVLKPAWYVDPVEVVELGQLAMFIAAHVVVTVRHGDSGPLTTARERLESDPEKLRWGTTAVLDTVLQQVVDEYVRVIIDLEQDIDEVEDRVFDASRADHGERIFNLKREVLDFRRGVDPLDRPLRELSAGSVRGIAPEARQRFVEQLDDLTRVCEHLQNLDSLLDSALAANVAAVGMRQNEDMRKISAGAALIAVPTLIAGVYGMNFEQMPELRWTTGYPMSIGLMVAAVGLMFWQFKKRDWL